MFPTSLECGAAGQARRRIDDENQQVAIDRGPVRHRVSLVVLRGGAGIGAIREATA